MKGETYYRIVRFILAKDAFLCCPCILNVQPRGPSAASPRGGNACRFRGELDAVQALGSRQAFRMARSLFRVFQCREMGSLVSWKGARRSLACALAAPRLR